MKTSPIALLAAALPALSAAPAMAEKADRDKPVVLEADKVTVDDRQQLHVYEGNVILTQGTLVIRSSRLDVKQDAAGYQRGIATGGPAGGKGLATFRQKREGRDDYVEGEAERIEHDNRTDKTEFFNQGQVKSGQDEVRGNYIVYDARTENYMVTGTGVGGTKPGGRVTAVIQPKNKGEPAAASPGPAPTPAAPAASTTANKEARK